MGVSLNNVVIPVRSESQLFSELIIPAVSNGWPLTGA